MVRRNRPKSLEINRQTLTDGILHKLASEKMGQNVKLLSDRELLDSRRSFIRDSHYGNNIWIFGYGSLIWNPSFNYDRRVAGRLFGYHRRFCLRTTITRGSPEKPGLVLGLDKGGSAQGVLFRIPASIAARECDLIWKREMLSDAYKPSWVKVKSSDGQVRKALTFIIRRSHPNFAAPISDEESIKIIAEASGIVGPNSEYLFKTEAALDSEGITDGKLKRLSNLLKIYQNL